MAFFDDLSPCHISVGKGYLIIVYLGKLLEKLVRSLIIK